MSDERSSSPSSSLQSSGITSAEELAEKHKKLFADYSRIKAQHSVLKKAVKQEQATSASLQEECKTKDQELRASLQQIDLLTFHNQRLTKRIESLQDSSSSKTSSGWFLGSAKKELEQLRTKLEAATMELQRKIEENETLHKKLNDVDNDSSENIEAFESKVFELDKKVEELQAELEKSRYESEEAVAVLRNEKNELHSEIDRTKSELDRMRSLMTENEQKIKDSGDSLRYEMDSLRDILSMHLGLSDDNKFDQFEYDTEFSEIIASYKQLQSSARDYLRSLGDNSGEIRVLASKVKKASQLWQQNLQILAIKLKSAQSQIADLKDELEKQKMKEESRETDSNKLIISLESQNSKLKEELENQKAKVEAMENDLNKIMPLETEITRLKEELVKQQAKNTAKESDLNKKIATLEAENSKLDEELKRQRMKEVELVSV